MIPKKKTLLFRPSATVSTGNTSGIVLAAKNAAALRELNQRIKDRQVQKRYLCVVHGRMPQPRQTLTAYLKKDADKNQVRVYDQPIPGRPDDSDGLSGVGGKRRLFLVEN